MNEVTMKVETIKSQYLEIKPNVFQFPHWSKIAQTYNDAVEKVLAEIESSRPFYNYQKGELGSDRLKETKRKQEMLGKVTKKGIVTIEVQLGQKYKGKSVKDARDSFQDNEFGLGAYEIGCLLLAKPEILKDYDDLWIDCAGDEFDDPDSGVRFVLAPYFSWSDGEVRFVTSWCAHADGRYGSASGFVPHAFEFSDPMSLESAIKLVKKEGYKVIKEL